MLDTDPVPPNEGYGLDPVGAAPPLAIPLPFEIDPETTKALDARPVPIIDVGANAIEPNPLLERPLLLKRPPDGEELGKGRYPEDEAGEPESLELLKPVG